MADRSRQFVQGLCVAERPASPVAEARRLGQEIARRRMARHLTQEQLAQQAGISRNQLQIIESGWSDRSKKTPGNPRLTSLIGISEVLGLRIVIDAQRPNGFVIEFGDPDPGV